MTSAWRFRRLSTHIPEELEDAKDIDFLEEETVPS